jgi:hypothetical protein
LYIDKELSPKEGLEVEAFIANNPSYALEMEALQATVLGSDKIQYPFKEYLKQQAETRLEELEEDWDTNYATILKADMQAIPALSTTFKNTLKKETVSEGLLIKPFGCSQNKLNYAAIAACLMIFLGYKQLAKTPPSNVIVANTKFEQLPNKNSNSNASSNEIGLINEASKTFAKVEVLIPKLNQSQKLNAQAINASKTQPIKVIQQESIVMAKPTFNNSDLKQTMIGELTSNYNNPITINAIPLPITLTNINTEPTVDEKVFTSYEIIETEDLNRTIFIANFEIDGNQFRGLKRKVTSLFKNNKSERNQ